MISYTILVKNEYNELDDLLDFLSHHTNADRSEIIIVGDSKKDEDLENVISRYDDVLKIHLYYRLLKNNFANQKNFVNSKCKGRYILNIDADEIPPVLVIENVFDIIDKNKDADAYFFPRINIVRSITQEYIKQMNWVQNDRGWINYPDFQCRLYKNSKNIRWVGRVHERLTGIIKFAHLPEKEEYSFIHIKNFERQKEQNKHYERIISGK